MAKSARFYLFYGTAWALIIVSLTAMAYGHSAWGSVAVLFSLGFLRRARASASVYVAPRDDQLPRPSRRLWIATAALTVIWAVSWMLLDADARLGYQEVWPVYVFAAAGLASGGLWIVVLGRVLQW